MKLSEDDLCRAFAEKIRASPEFAFWLLAQTKFAEYSTHARLLHREQMSQRPHVRPECWWRHWHTSMVKSGTGQETDIFLAFETMRANKRFAFFIENKKRLRLSKREAEQFQEQAAAYRPRARYTMNKKKESLCCDDFETVLLAPRIFRETYRSICDFFDR